jgi:hypothetical protein
MKDEFIDYIDDMLDAISKIQTFLFGFDFVTFSEDDKTQFAVISLWKLLARLPKRSRIISRYFTLMFRGMKLPVCGIN